MQAFFFVRLKSYTGKVCRRTILAATAEELEAIYNDCQEIIIFDLQNAGGSDSDSLPDEFEFPGLVVSNADFSTDPENPVMTKDRLLDGKEISIENPKFVIKKKGFYRQHAEYSSLVFRTTTRILGMRILMEWVR